MENEDGIIIRDVLNGKKEKYAMLVEKYQNDAYRFAFKITGNKEDAKDIAQEAFLKSYLYLKSYNPAFKFQNWLYKIILNVSRNLKSKQQRDECLPNNLQDCATEKETSSLLDNSLEHAVRILPHDYKEVIILRHFQDLTYNEISEILNIPVHVVKIRLHRARNKLKDILKK